MRTRLLSLFMSILLCLGIVAVPVSAIESDPLFQGDGQVDHVDQPDEDIYVDPNLTMGDLMTSPEAIAMLQDMEGYIAQPKWDVSQMSIGYGCSTVYAEKYGFSTQSLSREEATQLLLCVVGELELEVKEFLDAHGVELSQTQFDSLISFTYNVGTSWLNPNYRLAKLLIDGNYTVNEFASAMGVWCHEGEKISNILIVRRIREIKLFLYGAYNLNDTPNKFCYLVYDANGGDRDIDIAFYLEGSPYEILFSATHEDGLYFQGWYTESGQPVTENTIVTDDLTVFAQWGEEEPVEIDITEIFSDVTPTSWFLPYVESLYIRGIVEGYPDATFRPERLVTTGEALKMILLAAGFEEPPLVESHWARNFLNLALEQGIIDTGEIIDLDVTISRALMAKVVVNAMGLERLSDEQFFPDTDNVYAQTLFDHGISDGYSDGSFGPERPLTRAELTTIVCRMYDN